MMYRLGGVDTFKTNGIGVAKLPPTFSASVGSDLSAFPRLNADGKPLPVTSAKIYCWSRSSVVSEILVERFAPWRFNRMEE